MGGGGCLAAVLRLPTVVVRYSGGGFVACRTVFKGCYWQRGDGFGACLCFGCSLGGWQRHRGSLSRAMSPERGWPRRRRCIVPEAAGWAAAVVGQKREKAIATYRGGADLGRWRCCGSWRRSGVCGGPWGERRACWRGIRNQPSPRHACQSPV